MSADHKPDASPAAFNVPPVHKSLHVNCSPQEAFLRFTRDIHLWWPLSTHSVAGPKAVLVAIEPHEGGRIFERDANGAEHTWGEVLRWDPPSALVFTWRPGRGPETEQEVSLSFAPAAGGTQVELLHSGWERLGSEAAEARDQYEGGWAIVFGTLYAAHANAGAHPNPAGG